MQPSTPKLSLSGAAGEPSKAVDTKPKRLHRKGGVLKRKSCVMMMPEEMPAPTASIKKSENNESKVIGEQQVMTPTLAALLASPNRLSHVAMEQMLSRGLRHTPHMELEGLAPFLTPSTIKAAIDTLMLAVHGHRSEPPPLARGSELPKRLRDSFLTAEQTTHLGNIARRGWVVCSLCARDWPASFLLHAMALMQKQSVGMKSPSLQALLVTMLDTPLDGASKEQGSSSSSSSSRVTCVWTPCANCVFDIHYTEWAEQLYSSVKQTLASMGKGSLGVLQLQACIKELKLPVAVLDSIAMPAGQMCQPMQLQAAPIAAGIIVLDVTYVQLFSSGTVEKLPADMMQQSIRELSGQRALPELSIRSYMHGARTAEPIDWLHVLLASGEVAADLSEILKAQPDALRPKSELHKLLAHCAWILSIQADSKLTDDAEAGIEAAWRRGFAGATPHTSGHSVDVGALLPGQDAALELFGRVSSSGAFGPRSAGRLPRLTRPSDLLFVKDVQYNVSPELLVLAQPGIAQDHVIYKRGHGAHNGFEPGEPAVTPLHAGVAFFIQGETHVAIAAGVRGPIGALSQEENAACSYFVNDLRAQQLGGLLIGAQLAAFGLVNYYGGDVSAEDDSTLTVSDVVDGNVRNSAAPSNAAVSWYNAVSRASMLTEAEITSGAGIRLLLDDMCSHEAYGLLRVTGSHRDACHKLEAITRHWLPWLRSLPESHRQTILASAGAEGSLLLTELLRLVWAAPQSERLYVGLQQLLHCGWPPAQADERSSATGAGCWKEVRSMSGGPIIGASLVTRREPATIALAPRERRLPAHLQDQADVPRMAERGPRAERGMAADEAGENPDDGNGPAGGLPPFVLAPVAPAGHQAPLRIDQRYRAFTMHIVPNDGQHRVVPNADGTQNVQQQRADGTWHTILRRGRARLGAVGGNVH
jgi:hypothetical protein